MLGCLTRSVTMCFLITLMWFIIGSAAGLDLMKSYDDTDTLTNFNMSVDIDSKKNLANLMFRKKVDYIEVSVYINNELFDNFLKKNNVTVNSTFAMPPYHIFVWVNDAGMNIHKMDYRFQMWSLGTLIPSVHKVNFNILLNNTDQSLEKIAFQNLSVKQMFIKIQQTFRSTVFETNSCSSLYVDYSYLCHRYERYTASEKCLASKCFMFNERHYFYEHDNFCCENMNSLLHDQMYIWLFLTVIFFSYLPLIVFWLHKEPKEEMNISKLKNQPTGQQPTGQQPTGQQPTGQQPIGQQPTGQQQKGQGQTVKQPTDQQATGQQPTGQQSTEGVDLELGTSEQQPTNQQYKEPQPTEQQATEQQPTDSDHVRLFCISTSNCKYYPWMGRWCYYLFEDERKCFIAFRMVCFYVLFLLFYVWWFLIANLRYKTTEFRQRSKMSRGADDYLVPIELLISGIWNSDSIFYVFSFIFATISNFFLAIMMVWPSIWTQSKHFVVFKIKYPDPIWRKFNCLHRRSLLINSKFWKQFWGNLHDNFCLRLITAILLGFVIIIVILFPLFDIMLHLPIVLYERIKDRNGKQNKEGDDNSNETSLRDIDFETNDLFICWPIFIGITLFAFIFYLSFLVSYIYPTAVVYSMVVSYTITGIMKNWEIILPILVLAGIVIFQFVKLVYDAFEPLHKMQVIIYQEYQKKLSDFNKLKAKFEELDDQIDQNGLRFPNFKELILRFPKLNSFIEIRDGHHFLTIPNINELLAVFPDLKGLILNKDGSLFFSVPKLVLSVFEKLILEKGGLYYVKCPGIDSKNIKYLETIIRPTNSKDVLIQEDGCYYIQVLDHSLEIKLPFETKEIEEFYFKCPDIETITQRFSEIKGFIKKHNGKYYMRVQGNIGNIDDAELKKYGFWSSEGCIYVQCQFLLDYWNKFPKTELITREENGNHTILGSFLKHKCYPILERGEFGLKTIFCIAEIVALSLLIAAFGISLYMLNGEKTVGKVVVAIFLTYIPKILNVITKPWHSDVSKIKMEDFVKEKIDEELQRKQNALTLKYILLVLQFYYKDMKIAK